MGFLSRPLAGEECTPELNAAGRAGFSRSPTPAVLGSYLTRSRETRQGGALGKRRLETE